MITNPLERRILELSYKHKLSHISSCLNCVNLIAEIYDKREDDEPFILANCHASLAHYVVLEDNGMCDAEQMIFIHGVHAHRDLAHGIWVSGGSLGQSETVACGLALADPNRTVWLVTSDGAAMEGATYEAFRIADKYCPNLKVFVVYNSLGAYGEISLWELPRLPESGQLYFVNQERYPEWLRGLNGHYVVMNEVQFQEAMAT